MKFRGSRFLTSDNGNITVTASKASINMFTLEGRGLPEAHDITPGMRSLIITKKAEQQPILRIAELINNNNNEYNNNNNNQHNKLPTIKQEEVKLTHVQY